MKKERKNTLRDSVFEALKALIITGQIPPGGRVPENEIAETLVRLDAGQPIDTTILCRALVSFQSLPPLLRLSRSCRIHL